MKNIQNIHIIQIKQMMMKFFQVCTAQIIRPIYDIILIYSYDAYTIHYYTIPTTAKFLLVLFLRISLLKYN